MMNAAIFAAITWYFDNVMPGENGTPRPVYFFLTPSYWGINFRLRRKYKGIPSSVRL
jgi:hypothetical protein